MLVTRIWQRASSVVALWRWERAVRRQAQKTRALTVGTDQWRGAIWVLEKMLDNPPR